MTTPTSSCWYHVPLMWLVVAIPLATVAAGFTTLWLAMSRPDPVVAGAGANGPAIVAHPAAHPAAPAAR
jgi:hypothetical protein